MRVPLILRRTKRASACKRPVHRRHSRPSAGAFGPARWVATIAGFALLATTPSLSAAAEAEQTGPHWRTWSEPAVSAPWSESPSLPQPRCVELATGLHRWDTTQQRWVSAQAEFEPGRANSFLARQTQCQLILAGDLRRPDAVDVLTPDGLRLRSTVLGIALVDRATGASVLLAEVRSSRPRRTGPGEVTYPDAMDGLQADVRYRLTLQGYEQDVVLREGIAPAQLAELGLNPATSYLLVLTEFTDAPPPDPESTSPSPRPTNTPADAEIRFGALRFVAGRAFDLATPSTGARVCKSWETIDNRIFLVESVGYTDLAPLLAGLPVAARTKATPVEGDPAQARPDPLPGSTANPPSAWAGLRFARLPNLLATAGAADESENRPADPGGELARANPQEFRRSEDASHRPGVVIDYPAVVVDNSAEVVLRGDTTYYVSGPYHVGGHLIIEGGAVVKYAGSPLAAIIAHGPVTCRTEPYHPAVFTSHHDDTVGRPIAAAVGQNSVAAYGDAALHLTQAGVELHDLRFRFLRRGIRLADAAADAAELRHLQFHRCETAVDVDAAFGLRPELSLRNALLVDLNSAFAGPSLAVRGEHLTIDRCATLVGPAPAGTKSVGRRVDLVNCLLVDLKQTGDTELRLDRTESIAGSTNPFRRVGAGAHYLDRTGFRRAGTTRIEPQLARELAVRTTWPPLPLTGTLDRDLRLSPQAARNPGNPDLGYHYDPVDFLWTGLVMTNGARLTVRPGTVIGIPNGPGLRLESGTAFVAEGEPGQPVRLTDPAGVQEEPLPCGWTNSTASVLLDGPSRLLTNVAAAPVLHLRGVQAMGWLSPATVLRANRSTQQFREVTARHSRFAGGLIQITGSAEATVTFDNTLFERVSLAVTGWPTVTALNNLFWGGSLRLERYSTAGRWTLRDNAFHDLDLLDVAGGLTHSHNAYLGATTNALKGTLSPGCRLSSFLYTNGPLGNYYALSTNLVDAGSRLADSAGLYHFTTRPSQQPEAQTTVDIGLHYPAMIWTPTGFAHPDLDADGVPDWAEDINGDGRVGTGETDWRRAEDEGLEVWITRPSPAGWLP